MPQSLVYLAHLFFSIFAYFTPALPLILAGRAHQLHPYGGELMLFLAITISTLFSIVHHPPRLTAYRDKVIVIYLYFTVNAALGLVLVFSSASLIHEEIPLTMVVTIFGILILPLLMVVEVGFHFFAQRFDSDLGYFGTYHDYARGVVVRLGQGIKTFIGGIKMFIGGIKMCIGAFAHEPSQQNNEYTPVPQEASPPTYTSLDHSTYQNFPPSPKWLPLHDQFVNDV